MGTVSVFDQVAQTNIAYAVKWPSASSCSDRCARHSRSIDQRVPTAKGSIPSEDRRPKSDRKLRTSPCSADRPHASPCTRHAPGGCVRTLGIPGQSMWQPFFAYLLLGSGERNSSTAAGIQVIAVGMAIQCNFRLIACKKRVNTPYGVGARNYLHNRNLRRMRSPAGATKFARPTACRSHPPPEWWSDLHGVAFLQSLCRFRGFYGSGSGLPPLPLRAGGATLIFKTEETCSTARRSLEAIAQKQGGPEGASGSQSTEDCGSSLLFSRPARTRFALAVFQVCTRATSCAGQSSPTLS